MRRTQRQPDTARAALESLLDRAYVRVLGFAYQVLGDAELAARAAEEIFLRQPHPEDDQALWVRVMDVVRAFVARGFVVRPPVPRVDSGQTALLHALAALPPEERALLLLRYHEGLPIEQIAILLGLTPDETRRRVAAARNRLIDHLDAR